MNTTLTQDVAWIRVDHESAAGAARRAAVDLATRLGMTEARSGEIGIAVTEIATNQLKHAGGGAVLLRACRRADAAGVEVVAMDAGPGMRDLRGAMFDGHSTAGTLGIGLGAVTRLATEWDAFTAPGRGTVLTLAFGIGGAVSAARPGPRAAALTRPMTGEELCGDGYGLRADGDLLTAMLVDGLGHGPLAARATDAATRAFLDATIAGPVELLRLVHSALQGTRGAAVAVVQLAGGQARYAGIGNIAGVVLAGGLRRGMVSYPGIAGANVRSFRETAYDVPAGAVLVLHSDGVTDRMTLPDGPALLGRSPLVIAATVLRDFGIRNDDASVLVISEPG